MAAIFGEGKIFFKLQRVHSLDTLWVENFDEIALSRTVKEIEANLCFAIFGKISKIQNGRHFWGGEIFLKLQRVHSLDTLWVENFDEIALSRTVKEIEANFVFCHFWQKFEHLKWPPFLRRGKFFEIAKSTLLGYPVGRKFRRICQICVLPFWAKIRKFKMAAIFGEGKIFGKLQRVHSLDTLWVENFDEIALSRTV